MEASRTRRLIALVLGAGACLLAACADTHSGFSCNSPSSPSFSSDDCRQRLQSSQCQDGGVETRGSVDAGTQQLCCVYEECTKEPFPE